MANQHYRMTAVQQHVTAQKEDNPMTTIINFLQHHNEKQEREIHKLFQKANSLDDKLDTLIQQKHLQIQDHKLFLAFLAHLEQQKIPANQLFKDVLQLPKHQFEARYNMKWVQVVTLSVTFLTILRTNEPESYKQFMR